jgi:hypothetical protein
MKYKINRDDTPIKADTIIIFIGLERYRCVEDRGKLHITKLSDGESDTILITPVSTNVIDLS